MRRSLNWTFERSEVRNREGLLRRVGILDREPVGFGSAVADRGGQWVRVSIGLSRLWRREVRGPAHPGAEAPPADHGRKRVRLRHRRRWDHVLGKTWPSACRRL